MAKAIYMRFPEGKTKTLTFSYDDGVEQDIRFIDILDKYNMKGTFNINSGLYPELTGIESHRLSEAMCKTLYKNHEVAIHGLTHPYLEAISPAHCTHEIIEDRRNLEKLTGKIIRGMAYPYGTHNDTVVEIIKNCGIAYARTTESTHRFSLPKDWLRLPATCHHRDPELMELAKNFVEFNTYNKTCKMFYVWGHTYEFDRADNWHVIEEFAQYMANREDIWYATNIEIYDYIKAYEQLIFDVDATMCINPTTTKLWLEKDNTIYTIEPGETLKF